ncbi:MAG TPA: hypothetical protein VF958_13845, partial [Thermoanaerobaculia bacterium]
MRGARVVLLAVLFPCTVGLSQTATRPTASAAFSGSLVLPADEHTETAVGGSVELDFPLSTSFSAGVVAGHWSGKSDLDKDSTETYLLGVVTHRWGSGRWRPFLHAGGGFYILKFQFQSRSRFSPSETETVGGGFAGPGVDCVLSPNSALELRARYHLV